MKKRLVFTLSLMLLAALLHAQTSGTWRIYNTTNSDIGGNTVLALATDAKNHLWVGTTNGLCRLNGKNSWTDYAMFNKKLRDQSVNCLTIDRQGLVWVGTDDYGVLAFDGSKWREYTGDARRLNMKFIGDIAIDNEGVKWFGVTLVGLVRYDDRDWELMTPNDSGLPSDFILCTTIDRRNRKWVGTNGGLGLFNGRRWISYTPDNSGIADAIVPAVVVDDEDVKWIGTLGGLCAFDGDSWMKYNKDNSPLPGNEINALAMDSRGYLWIATDGGVAVFDRKERWETFTPEKNKLPKGSITSLVTDSDNDVYVGYDLYGVARLSGFDFPAPAKEQPVVENKKPAVEQGNDAPAEEKIRVVPYLADGYVTITFDGAEADVEFFNSAGKSVRHIPHYKRGAHINITKMARTLYTLKVKTAKTEKELKFNLK